MAQAPLDPDIVSAIKEITHRYITDGQSTPAHVLKARLPNKRHLLDKVAQEPDGYLLNLSQKYLPRYQALEFVESSIREFAQQCTTLVLKAMRAVYERDGDRMCNHDVLLQMCRTLDLNASPKRVSIGMLFAKDFQQLVNLWNIPDGENSLTLSVSDRLLDFDDLQSAWERELKHNAESTSAQNDETGQIDGLLPIFNRSQFDADIPKFAASANEAAPLALIMLDVDHFKQVNDTYGHDAGDEVLKATASAMKAVCKSKGRCYRWGGDELAALLPNHTVGEARAVADRIQEAFSRFELKQYSERITLSIGIASYPGACASAEELFKRADGALYDAKEAGRDQICLAADGAAPTSAPSLQGTRAQVIRSPETLLQQIATFQQRIETLEQERIQAEHLPIAISLQQAIPANYIISLKNESDIEISIEGIRLLHEGIELCGTCKPKRSNDWKIAPNTARHIEFAPSPDPVGTLALKPRIPMGVVTTLEIILLCKIRGRLLERLKKQLVTIDYASRQMTPYGP
jgi:diguanylate cyclase (GGDEF)-like protein